MSKINQGYTSLFEYLSDNFGLFRSLEADYYLDQVDRLNQFGSRRYNPYPSPFDQLIGSLQPFADMWKDFKNTFRPYKSMMYFGYDLLQPFYGIGNIVAGIVNIVGPIVIFAGMVAVNFWKTKIRDHNDDLCNFNESVPLKGGIWIHPQIGGFKERTTDDLKLVSTWMLNGVAKIIRGVTQIIATPFTWTGKIVLRTFINTVYSACWGDPKLEDNPGIRRLVKQGEEVLRDIERFNQNRSIDFYQKTPENAMKEIQGIEWDLHRKYLKATGRYQNTAINQQAERTAYLETKDIGDLEQKKQSALVYLGLFGGKKEEMPEEGLQSPRVYHTMK